MMDCDPSVQRRTAPSASNGRVEAEPRMDVEHFARAVVYMVTLPLHANVQFMTVMPTKMPYIGRGSPAPAEAMPPDGLLGLDPPADGRRPR